MARPTGIHPTVPDLAAQCVYGSGVEAVGLGKSGIHRHDFIVNFLFKPCVFRHSRFILLAVFLQAFALDVVKRQADISVGQLTCRQRTLLSMKFNNFNAVILID